MSTETEVEQTDARVQGRTDAVVMLEAARSDPQMQLPSILPSFRACSGSTRTSVLLSRARHPGRW